MKFQWESEDMAWGFYLSIKWDGFMIAITVANIDIQFHVLSFRDLDKKLK